MKLVLPAIVAIAMAVVASPAVGQSVYKCTGPDGAVSFQDRPCDDANTQQRVSVDRRPRPRSPGLDSVVVGLPGGYQAGIGVFDYMDASVDEDGDRATTIRLTSKPGAPARVSATLTIMPNKRGEMLSREERERAVRRVAVQQARRTVHTLEMHEFEARSGLGLLTVLDNRGRGLGGFQPGDYLLLTVALIVSDGYVVAVTILAPEIFGINKSADELALPPPPTGFSWQRAPRIKGAFLVPEGWHYHTRQEDKDHQYFISLEPYAEPDGYDTGLSVKVTTGVPEKTGLSPSAYAAKFIRTMQGEFETLEEPFTAQRPPFESHGALFTVTDPDKGPFNAFMTAIANDSTGTVYFCIFEGPADRWDTLWPIGEVMLVKLVVNDSI